MTKTEAKALAKRELMHGIGNALGYGLEDASMLGMSDDEIQAIQAEMWKIADRIAKSLGYEAAWSN
jgi:hypothetical protein